MTREQRRIIAKLERDILNFDGYSRPDKYEYKKFAIEKFGSAPLDGDYDALLTTIVGQKADEGTMAAMLARKTRMIVIKSNGSVQSLLGNKVSGYGKVLLYGYQA